VVNNAFQWKDGPCFYQIIFIFTLAAGNGGTNYTAADSFITHFFVCS